MRHLDKFENERAGKLRAFERHRASGMIDLRGFAAEIIPWRKPAPVTTRRHFQLEGVEAGGGKSGMQTELEMRGQLRFVDSGNGSAPPVRPRAKYS